MLLLSNSKKVMALVKPQIDYFLRLQVNFKSKYETNTELTFSILKSDYIFPYIILKYC